ncbi:MAG TPA: ABC transporter ATP-binding protein [Clostridia bacterium]|nr:ABC transporter ATP-binding protein [Clostridia bacterium]HRU84246.1 ABC transporter ATP-binding protein [Eubacteriales bacterium]
MAKSINAMNTASRAKGRTGARPKNFFPTFKRIMATALRTKAAKLKFALLVLLIIISAAASVTGTFLLRSVIDDYIAPLIGQTNPDLTAFIRMLTVLAAIFAVGSLAQFTLNRLCVFMFTKTLAEFRDELFEHMVKLPIKYFDTHPHGEIMSTFTNDTDTFREMLTTAIPQIISSALSLILTFAMMMALSWVLTLIVVAMLGIMLFAASLIGGRSGKFFRAQQKNVAEVNAFVEEYIEGQRVVKVFCHEDKTKTSFDAINRELQKESQKAHTNANILMPIMGNLSYLTYAIVAATGALFILKGGFGLTVGAIAAYLLFTRQLSQPIAYISQQVNVVMQAIAGGERIFVLLDAEAEKDEGYVTLVNADIDADGNITESAARTGKWAWKHPHRDGTLTYTEVKGNVEFDNVNFGYVSETPVLLGISMYANDGQRVALVGSTGAGKTTITNLINRFYDVPDGKIRYDKININKIKKHDLRRSLSMVLQDVHLFTGTVMENIRYGKLDATDDEVIAAAVLANAHSFITHLPDGYNTLLTADGANLSQGQRQLIAIARAAVADPPVLILDEATSSVDTRTERLIEIGMKKLMEGRTVFIIAHRLSTVRNADVILVMEKGEIIERGSHEQLLEKRGKYYSLYTGAFELS